MQIGDIRGAQICDLDPNPVTCALTNVATPRDKQREWHGCRYGTCAAECGHPPKWRSTESAQVGRDAALTKPGDVMPRGIEWILATAVVTSCDSLDDPSRGCTSHAVPSDAMLLRFPRRNSRIPRERRDDVGQLRLRRVGHGMTLRDVRRRVRRNSRPRMTPMYRTCGRGTTCGSTSLAKTTLGRGLCPLWARPSVVLASRRRGTAKSGGGATEPGRGGGGDATLTPHSRRPGPQGDRAFCQCVTYGTGTSTGPTTSMLSNLVFVRYCTTSMVADLGSPYSLKSSGPVTPL